MKKPRRPQKASRKVSPRLPLRLEQLEDRTLLNAANVVAQLPGVLNSPTDTRDVNIAINSTDFTLGPAQKLILGLQVEAQNNNLDPAVVQVRDASGNLVTPLYANADLAGKTQSLSVT